MKMRILFLSFCLAMTFCSCSANSPQPPKSNSNTSEEVDSVIYKKLGKSLYELLSNPQKVECYTLLAKEKISDTDVVIEAPFVRDSLVSQKLDAADVAVLKFLLPMDRDNYENDTIIIRSPYLPTLDFVFSKKKMEAHVLVSLSDRSWTIVFDDKTQHHSNYADKRLVARFCRRFLKKD